MAKPNTCLLIGDTILNLTYRASPQTNGAWRNPFNFLNEEMLTLDESGSASIQGVGYIARYLAAATVGSKPLVCTNLRSEMSPGIDALRSDVRAACDARSILDFNSAPMPTVVRVLRNVASTHAHGVAPAYRPQLRLDSMRSKPPAIDDMLDELIRHLLPGDYCLVRTTTPEFLAAAEPDRNDDGDYSYEELAGHVRRRVERLQSALRDRDVTTVIDLRPIPKNLEILDHRTIVSTTVSRIREFLNAPANAPTADVVAAAFWRLSPARALVCFAPDEGAILCVREPGVPSSARLVSFVVDTRLAGPDGCGLIVGGDAFVAAFLASVLSAGRSGNDSVATFIQATSAAAEALRLAIKSDLGTRINPADVAPIIRATTDTKIARTGLIDTAKEAPLDGGDVFWKPGIIAPAGGKLRAVFEKIEIQLKQWAPRPGSDLIAIFGESRCGKEYPLKKLLSSLGFLPLPPVNMFQFLQDPAKLIKNLKHRGKAFDEKAPHRSVLIVDEVMPGDAARALLNLTAEKAVRGFSYAEEDIDFTQHLVVILSSIDPDHLLPDLYGRMRGSFFIPPLRDRPDEIPLLIGTNLYSALGKPTSQLPPLQVGYRALSALLCHDYRAARGQRDRGEEEGTGLQQQNFRALQDILLFAYEKIKRAGRTRVNFDDLPSKLHDLTVRTESDDHGICCEISETGKVERY